MIKGTALVRLLGERLLARIIRGKAAIEAQPFRNEGKAVVP